MSNLQRALEAIAAAIDGFTAPEAIPAKAVENLQHAGLITPDTPQPFFERGHGPNWEIPINDQGGGIATVRTLGGDVYIERPGHGHGHGFITSPAEARQLAAAIIAAANYQEEA